MKSKYLNLFLILTTFSIITLANLNFSLSLIFIALMLLITIAIWCFYKIEVWVLCYFFSIIVIPELNINNFSFHVSEFLFLTGFIIFLTRLKYFKFKPLLHGTSLILILIFSIAAINSINILSAFSYLKLIEMIFPIFVLSTYSKKYFSIDFLLNCLVVFSALGAMISIILFILNIQTDIKTVALGGNVISRLGGVFGEANSYGQFNAMIALLIIVIILEKRKKHLPILLIWLSLFLVLIATVLTFSRAAILYFVTGFLIISIYKFTLNNVMKFFFPIIIAFIGLSTTEYFQSTIERMRNVITFDAQTFNQYSGGRLNIWQNAIEEIENKFIGMGYNNEKVIDNNYITIFYENGLIGLLAFLIFLISIIYISIKIEQSTLKIFLVAALVSLLAQMLVLDTFTFWRSITILFILIGVGSLNDKDSKLMQGANTNENSSST